MASDRVTSDDISQVAGDSRSVLASIGATDETRKAVLSRAPVSKAR